MLVEVITEIGDSGIFRLNLVGHTENGSNGRERRWHELTVNARVVLGQLNHASRGARHPPGQRTRRTHLVLRPTGTRHSNLVIPPADRLAKPNKRPRLSLYLESSGAGLEPEFAQMRKKVARIMFM